jgi:hypothetical protein
MANFTASAAADGIQPKALRVGLQGQAVVYDHTTVSLSINTNITMMKVAKNTRVLFMQYGFTGTGDATFQIGDGVNGTRYKSAGTLSAGQGMVMANTFSMGTYVYSADDTIIVRTSLSSATTLGGEFHINAIFAMDA